jgi:DNA replication protein DnaC
MDQTTDEVPNYIEEMKCRRCGTTFQGKVLCVLDRKWRFDTCPECEAKWRAERAEQDRLEAERKRIEIEGKWGETCPKEYRTTREGGNTVIARLEREQPQLQALLRWQGPRGLILRGETGACKTRCLWRLMRRLWVEKRGFEVLTAGQFDRQCRDAGGNFTLTEWFDGLANVEVLCIDDLGKGAWSDGTEANWFDLVDERGRNERPIIITTNDTGSSLESRMKPERAAALVRRLRDYCDVMIFEKCKEGQ